MSKIFGNTTTTPMPQSDWAQTNNSKADYIKNKPTLGALASKNEIDTSDLSADVQAALDKANSAMQSYAETDPTVPDWAKAETKPTYTADEVKAIPASQKGAPNGVAELDKDGKVLSAQLPSYVDDVVEYSSKELFPTQGESDKIYIDTSTNITYRWSGTVYTPIGSDLALGETSASAYRGDRGKEAYDHSQITDDNPHGITKTHLGLENVENKSSATILGELTKDNVTNALGYTPPETDTVYTHPDEHPASMITGLASVATSGKYTDLTDVPAIPTKMSELDNDMGYLTKVDAPDSTEALQTSLNEHISKTDNPHGVTKEQLGLENVENKSSATILGELTKDNVTNALGYTPPETVPTKVSELANDAGYLTKADAPDSIEALQASLDEHIGIIDGNPHGVSKTHLGLENVDNTSDANKPVSTAQAEAIAAAKQAGVDAQTNLTTHKSDTGSSDAYGHVKLSDATNSTSGVGDGIAATPAAVKEAYDLATKFIVNVTEVDPNEEVFGADKTFDEIVAAYNAGKTIVASYGTGQYQLLTANVDKYFEFVSQTGLHSCHIKIEKDGTIYYYESLGAAQNHTHTASDVGAEASGTAAGLINRTTAVNVADANYDTLMARGTKLLDKDTADAVTDWETELVNGAIAWIYE